MNRFLLISLAAWVAFSPISDARAYVVLTDGGKELKWRDSDLPLNWYFDSQNAPDSMTDGQTQRLLEQAFSTWANVECTTLEFVYGGKIRLSMKDVAIADGYDRKNVFKWVLPEDWPHDFDNAFAVTVPVYDLGNGRLLDSDLLFLNSYEWSAGPGSISGHPDFLSIALHEIGHLFGLDHSPDYDATMYFSAVSGEIHKRSLSLDDMRGVCYIYPDPGQAGYDCLLASECDEGSACLAPVAGGPTVCAPPCVCDHDCPPFLSCQDGSCIPVGPELGGIGDPCDETTLCAGDTICVNDLCSIFCDTAADCPDGWRCYRLFGGGSGCYPSNPSSDGDDSAASSLTCTLEPDTGTLNEPVTISCEGPEGSSYRLLARSLEGAWTVVRDWEPAPEGVWRPRLTGLFDLRVESRPLSSTACHMELFETTYAVWGGTTDGDDELKVGGSSDGCSSSASLPPFLLTLLLLAVPARRRWLRR